MVWERDARREERGEGRPPVELGQADPTERRGTGAVALGESEGGAGKAAGQSVGAERSQRVRGVRLWVRLGARIMLEVLDGSDKWGEFEE